MTFAEALRAAGLTVLDARIHAVDLDVLALAWSVHAARTDPPGDDRVCATDRHVPAPYFEMAAGVGPDDAARRLAPFARPINAVGDGARAMKSTLAFDDVDIRLVGRGSCDGASMRATRVDPAWRGAPWSPERAWYHPRLHRLGRPDPFDVVVRDGDAGLDKMLALLDALAKLGTFDAMLKAHWLRQGRWGGEPEGLPGLRLANRNQASTSLVLSSGVLWNRFKVSRDVPSGSVEAMRHELETRWETRTLDRIAAWFQPCAANEANEGTAITGRPAAGATLAAAAHAGRARHIATLAAFLEETAAPADLLEACRADAEGGSGHDRDGAHG